MGIRESLKQQPDELNFKDFTMPEDELKQKLKFDVEKDIYPKEKEFLSKLSKNELSATNLMAFKIVFESIPENLNTNLETELTKILNNYRPSNPGDTSLSGNTTTTTEAVFEREIFLEYIAPLKLNYPNFDFIKFFQDQEDGILEELANFSDLEIILGRANCEDYVKYIALLKILLPSVKLPESAKVLPTIRESLRELRDENRWDLFIKLAGYASLAFSDGFETINVSEKDWKNMINEFKKWSWQKKANFATQLWPSFNIFLEDAMLLKILAAKEVRITDQGLELIMPEKQDYKSKIPPRPERRNF